VVEAGHPALGTMRTVGVPVKLRETPGSVRTPPPRIGEHTAAILARLGYDATAIADLHARKIVAWPDDRAAAR
jgi:crotonobetainyl-CoA:carnitine CoA-transferase CaiB-like acyl-CoA transferase